MLMDLYDEDHDAAFCVVKIVTHTVRVTVVQIMSVETDG